MSTTFSPYPISKCLQKEEVLAKIQRQQTKKLNRERQRLQKSSCIEWNGSCYRIRFRRNLNDEIKRDVWIGMLKKEDRANYKAKMPDDIKYLDLTFDTYEAALCFLDRVILAKLLAFQDNHCWIKV
jgi:hypothetical protein